jgi:hypothetical protein
MQGGSIGPAQVANDVPVGIQQTHEGDRVVGAAQLAPTLADQALRPEQ